MSREELSVHLIQLEEDISQQLQNNEKLLKQLRSFREERGKKLHVHRSIVGSAGASAPRPVDAQGHVNKLI